jgi:adenylate cyclase
MLTAMLSQALRLAGHLEEALQANIEATSRVHEIGEVDRQLFNFDVERWLTIMQGQILVLLGRFDEARPYLDRVLQSEIDSRDITLHLPSVAYVDLAWGEDNPALADFHAERAMEMAADGASPYVRVNALTCRGVSQMISGRYAAAVEDLERALAFARFRKAGLESEARILADLANAYRLKGDRHNAARAAAEAIEVASARANRVPECVARAVHAEVLLLTGEGERAASELRRAKALLEETDARLYEPLIRELSARMESSADEVGGAAMPHAELGNGTNRA